jgi:hypothetical protein
MYDTIYLPCHACLPTGEIRGIAAEEACRGEAGVAAPALFLNPDAVVAQTITKDGRYARK